MYDELKAAMDANGLIHASVDVPPNERGELLKEFTEKQECYFIVIPQTPFIERFNTVEQVLAAAFIASVLTLGFILGRLSK